MIRVGTLPHLQFVHPSLPAVTTLCYNHTYVIVPPTSLQDPSIHLYSSSAQGSLGTCLLNDLLAK